MRDEEITRALAEKVMGFPQEAHGPCRRDEPQRRRQRRRLALDDLSGARPTMKNLHYVLEGGVPFAEPDVLEWGLWMQSADRRVALDTVQTPDGEARVSTLFLGLDHSFSDNGSPILWETMVFGGKYDQWQQRYGSLLAARDGHARVVAALRDGRSPDDADEDEPL